MCGLLASVGTTRGQVISRVVIVVVVAAAAAVVLAVDIFLIFFKMDLVVN